MIALVTGGAGFIGSEVVRQLTRRGDQVVVIDNLVNGKRENLVDADASKLRLVVDDIRRTDVLGEWMQGVDVVYHLACLGVRHSIHNPIENHDVNATATLHLLEAARKKGVKRFVCVSTSEVYGTAQTVPMTENHPTIPHTVYGASKLAGEGYARAFYKTYGYSTVVVRPFNSFGPFSHHEGDSGEVIPKFILRALADQPLIVFGDGSQTRDFTYVSDTAEGIIAAGTVSGVDGETFNLGNNKEIKVIDLAQQILEIIAQKNRTTSSKIKHEQPRPGDVLRLYADSSRAIQKLGYQSEIGFKAGLCKLVDWYLSLPYSPRDLLKNEKILNWKAD